MKKLTVLSICVALVFCLSIPAFVIAASEEEMMVPPSYSDLDEALKAAQKAIELEPNSITAYAELASVRVSMGEFFEAGLAFQKAVELASEPLGTIFDYINFLCDVGYFEEAYKLNQEVLKSDSSNEQTQMSVIELSGYLKDMTKVEEAYDHTKTLYGDDCFLCKIFITNARLGSGNAVSKEDILIPSPIHDAAKGFLDSPKEGLDELHKFYNNEEYQDAAGLTSVAFWAAYFGDPEFAMDAIGKAFNLDPGNINNYWYPLFKEVRQLQEFKELVRKLGLVDYWKQFGWPNICHPTDDGDFECD